MTQALTAILAAILMMTSVVMGHPWQVRRRHLDRWLLSYFRPI
jgi:hypothetical protein